MTAPLLWGVVVMNLAALVAGMAVLARGIVAGSWPLTALGFVIMATSTASLTVALVKVLP